jgi:hypothetical protein
MNENAYNEQMAALIATLPDDILLDMLNEAIEACGEIKAQYGSEVALYGDAWPGAQIDLDNAYQAMQRFQAEDNRRWPPQTVADPADDIPF